MQLGLGAKIRELRHRCGQKQETLAEVLGVTPQAVSRWESGGSYPDMEIIPSLANYFGVTIDELFGYGEERNDRIRATVARLEEMNGQNSGKNVNIEECIHLSRRALIEFPGNERLMLCLASALYNAGYVRHGEWHLEDADGYDIYDTDAHRAYAEWQEAILLYEKLLTSAKEADVRHRATRELIHLYANLGEYEKASGLANTCAPMKDGREWMLADACDGKRRAEYLGEGIFAAVEWTAEQMIQCLISVHPQLSPSESANIISRAIALFDCICEEGEYGMCHAKVAELYLYLSAYQWQAGEKDTAFASLDRALACAKAYDQLSGRSEDRYAMPLFRHLRMNPEGYDCMCLTQQLPERWPGWGVPDLRKVKEEMQSSPRWWAWVDQTRNG